MLEKIYELSKATDKTIKQIINDENIHYNQMILRNGDALPEHYTNSTVYMTVVRGKLTISLDGKEFNEYNAGTILKIAYNTKMNARNQGDELLELLVIKAPAPRM